MASGYLPSPTNSGDLIAELAARAPKVGANSGLWPGLTIVTFVLLIAAWALLTGGLMTVAAFRLQQDHGR